MFHSDVIDDFTRRYGESLIRMLGVTVVAFESEVLVAEALVGGLSLNSQGVWHGGLSPFVAETLGSFASLYLQRHDAGVGVAGVSVFSHHLHPAVLGDRLRFTVRPLRCEGRSHVWSVEMRRGDGLLLSSSQVAVVIVRRNADRATAPDPVA